ncbi:MAG: exodeoxyribonuclease VII large subunit [Candidatus Omnitrophota bacterium]
MPSKQRQLNIDFTIEDDKYIYTVSLLTRNIKKVLEDNFPAVWVEGEISNLSTPASGHIYFTLKDEKAQMRAVIFRNISTRVKFQLAQGMQVVCFGKISIYELGGQYQLYVEQIEPKGLGALQLAFNQLKEKLYKQGLFDPRHKKAIPLFPQHIGIVTSSTGAAICDILNVLGRRFANVQVIVYPVMVQGEKASLEIAQAIEDFNTWGKVDVIIVTRGGGSIEDLWAFNEEIVARAIFASAIPVISAVGHEIDYTIADFAADLRAPTPSAAAELVVTCKVELVNKITQLVKNMHAVVINKVIYLNQRLETLKQSYALNQPQYSVIQYMQRIDELLRRLQQGLQYKIKGTSDELHICLGRLEALSPLAVLSRGYSITLYKGKIIRDTACLKVKDEIVVRLHQGEILGQIKKIIAMRVKKTEDGKQKS